MAASVVLGMAATVVLGMAASVVLGMALAATVVLGMVPLMTDPVDSLNSIGKVTDCVLCVVYMHVHVVSSILCYFLTYIRMVSIVFYCPTIMTL